MKPSGSLTSLIGFTRKMRNTRDIGLPGLSPTELHPNQEAFVTSDGNHVQEGEFWGCLSRLKQEKCVESIDRHRIPADAWEWITPFGEETLKLFARRCLHHYFRRT